MAQTLYDILEVAPSASAETIRAAYISLIKRYHPDSAGGETLQRAQAITSAYDVLKDAQQRASYDAQLRRTADDPLRGEEPPQSGPAAAQVVNLHARQFAAISLGTAAGQVFSVLAFLLLFKPVLAILGTFVSFYQGMFSSLVSFGVSLVVGYAGWAVGLMAAERYICGEAYTFQTREAEVLRAAMLGRFFNPDILLGAFVIVCLIRLVFVDGLPNTLSGQLGCALGACIAHRSITLR